VDFFAKNELVITGWFGDLIIQYEAQLKSFIG